MARRKSFASLSIEALVKLRDDVGAALMRKGKELRAQLDSLGGGGTSVGGGMVGNGRRRGRPPGVKRRRSALAGRKVAPKYRNPKTGETWSGRGAMAGWLAAAIKAGKKRDDFLIVKGHKTRKVRR